MSWRKIKFGNKEINKKEFYSSKEAILLDFVDLNKIVVSKKWNIDDKTYKYFCGYLNNDVIKPLCVILPQMNGYILLLETATQVFSYEFCEIFENTFFIEHYFFYSGCLCSVLS